VAKDKVKIPKDLKGRLKDVAKKHNFASAEALADHFVDKGLTVYEATSGSLSERLTKVVDEKGYSSEEELVEHLLLRGLRAYEEPADDPKALEARLRGLGYID
jgi:hypothetical protein